MVALPSVLRRCSVTAARLEGDDLCVTFAPDPAVWTR
jgi:arsenite-transporting ATPase